MSNISNSGTLLQLFAVGREQANTKIQSVLLVKKSFGTPVIEANTNISKYTIRQTRDSDTVRLTHLLFEKLDNAPLNFLLEILIGGQHITTISNEIISSQDVKVISMDASTNCTKYRVELPFSKMWHGNDVHTVDTGSLAQCLGTDVTSILRPSRVGLEFNVNGIPLIACAYHDIEYRFKTTNKLDNVNLVYEDIYLDGDWRSRISQTPFNQNIIQTRYTHGLSNRRIELEHGGIASGYYIHCHGSIKNIKMLLNNNTRHDLDADLIDIQCQRVNSYTIYMPTAPGNERFNLNRGTALNHSRLNSVSMIIDTEEAIPVCIVSEVHCEIKYESGMGGLTTINGAYYKNLVYTPDLQVNKHVDKPAIPLLILTENPECAISNEQITAGMEYSKCIRCVGVFQYEVMKIWWAQNHTCPYCRVALPELKKYVNSAPDPSLPNPMLVEEPVKLQHWELPGVAI